MARWSTGPARAQEAADARADRRRGVARCSTSGASRPRPSPTSPRRPTSRRARSSPTSPPRRTSSSTTSTRSFESLRARLEDRPADETAIDALRSWLDELARRDRSSRDERERCRQRVIGAVRGAGRARPRADRPLRGPTGRGTRARPRRPDPGTLRPRMIAVGGDRRPRPRSTSRAPTTGDPADARRRRAPWSTTPCGSSSGGDGSPCAASPAGEQRVALALLLLLDGPLGSRWWATLTSAGVGSSAGSGQLAGPTAWSARTPSGSARRPPRPAARSRCAAACRPASGARAARARRSRGRCR